VDSSSWEGVIGLTGWIVEGGMCRGKAMGYIRHCNGVTSIH
jgi:hypothetical protein